MSTKEKPNLSVVVKPEDFATLQDFVNAALTRTVDRAVSKGLINRYDANRIKKERIQATGIPYKRKTKRKPEEVDSVDSQQST